jgi:Cys-tRNA(Pro)/Cys-tRNA(Cys) deacylase
MTPAITWVQKHKIKHTVHEYQHDTDVASYGLEAIEKLGVSPQSVFKTLVVAVEPKALIVAIVPVMSKLNMKLLAKVVGAKKASMALAEDVERSTGYVLGGVSPLGQKKRLRTVIDNQAIEQGSIYVSAGRRGLELALSVEDLQQSLDALFADICQA